MSTIKVPDLAKLPTDPEARGKAASDAIKALTEAAAPFYDVRTEAILAMLEGDPKADRPPMRPADVARVIGVTRAFMARYTKR